MGARGYQAYLRKLIPAEALQSCATVATISKHGTAGASNELASGSDGRTQAAVVIAGSAIDCEMLAEDIEAHTAAGRRLKLAGQLAEVVGEVSKAAEQFVV